MTVQNRTDEQLITEIKNGSLEDFQIFYERYFSYVYKIVFSVLRNETDALDVCQDLFLEYYQKAHTFHEKKGSVKAWIAIRAKSRAIDYIRKKKRVVLQDQVMVHENLNSDNNTVEERALLNIEREKLVSQLKNLPKLQREAIYLNYGMSLSHRETAKILKRPLGTVKSLIRYGIKNLRKDFITSNEGIRGDQDEKK